MSVTVLVRLSDGVGARLSAADGGIDAPCSGTLSVSAGTLLGSAIDCLRRAAAYEIDDRALLLVPRFKLPRASLLCVDGARDGLRELGVDVAGDLELGACKLFPRDRSSYASVCSASASRSCTVRVKGPELVATVPSEKVDETGRRSPDAV